MRESRFGAIDALRGLAISLVILYHAGPLAWRLAPYDAQGWLIWPALGWKWIFTPFLHFGFAGVHCFFVLSGFCIHLRVARERIAGVAGGVELRSYFLRRFWRIYPPYWIALAIFAVVAGSGWRDFLLHASMLHTFSERSFFSINPAFWSLATEEQFYLMYPLVVAALARWPIRRVLAGALAISLLWRAGALLMLPPTVENFLAWRVFVHGLFLPRWFEWLLGCWVAELAAAPSQPLVGRARPLAILGAALLALAMISRVHVAADKLLSDALFGGGFAAITGAALGASPAKKARTFPAPAGGLALSRVMKAPVLFLRAMGRRAYGLYLVHQPILDCALPLVVRGPLAVAAGWLFSRIFERPFEKRSQAIARPRWKEAA